MALTTGLDVRQRNAHHRAAHDEFVGIRLEARRGEQMRDRRADGDIEIARSLDVAGHRDDAPGQRFALFQRAPDGERGRDVEALHAVVGRAAAVRHLDAGQHADQLLGAAGRVARRHHDDFE
jgi:hypothetical protein